MSTGPGGALCARRRSRLGIVGRRMLLSFERPSAQSERCALFADLENCTALPTNGYHRVLVTRPALHPTDFVGGGNMAALRVRDHRQDRKGTWWMPWHQESMKGVNGCDKPRGGAE